MDKELLFGSDNINETGWEVVKNVDFGDLAMERLRDKAVDMKDVEEGVLAEDFQSGHFLYHGASNDVIDRIIMSGYLGNAMAVHGKVGTNSGYEGISWSMDGIDALPGTNGHIAGFVAAPELVLGEDTKLVIPSRPAPFEMLQISSDVETEIFYEHRIQDEMCSNFGFSEMNSIRANFEQILMWQKEQKSEKPNEFVAMPMMFQFLEKEWTDEDLGQLYTFDEEEKTTKFSKNLFQQWDIPVGAVWIKRIIDGGLFNRQGPYYGDPEKTIIQKIKKGDYERDSVRTIIQKIKDGDEDLLEYIISATTGGIRKHYDEALSEDLRHVGKIRVPVERMYFVTKREDLDGWIKKFIESGHKPKGFLLYDEEKVVKINFASKEKGDHEELADEIGRVIGMKNDFWAKEMGMDIKKLPRSGGAGQVIKETEVERNKVLKIVNGELSIVDERAD